MVRPLFVPFVWLAACSAVAASEAGIWSLPKLRENYERNVQGLGRDYEAEVDCVYHPCTQPGAEPDEGANDQAWGWRIRHLFSGVRFRVDRWRLHAADGSSEPFVPTGDHCADAFDGRQLRRLTAWRSPVSVPRATLSGLIKPLDMDESQQENRAILRRRAADVSRCCWPCVVSPELFDTSRTRVVSDLGRPHECLIELTHRDSPDRLAGREVVRQRVWLMVGKGCVIGRARGFDARGRTVYEYTADDVRKVGSVWLAHRAKFRQFALVRGTTRVADHTSVHLRRIVLRPEISVGGFEVVFPPGTRVNDLVAGRSYVVGKSPRS